MNCTTCGMEFLFGGNDRHKMCRDIEAREKDRNKRLDVLLEIFKEDIELRMVRE